MGSFGGQSMKLFDKFKKKEKVLKQDTNQIEK